MNLTLDLSVPQLNSMDIRNIRESLGWSREYLARILCISAGSIYFWENGKRVISKRNQEALLELVKHINKFNRDKKKDTG